MATYLISGGAGFIGSNFIRYLLQSDQEAYIVNLDALTYAGNLSNLAGLESNSRYIFVRGDILDTAVLNTVFSQHSVDIVVHFAAESHVDRSIKDPLRFVRTNVLGTVNLLDTCKNHWLKNDCWKNSVRFIQVSTDEVYGSLGDTGYFTEETPLNPRSPYSASKAAADSFVQAYGETYGMPINITRCSNNYGPYQMPEKWIPLIINNALTHRPIPVFGDGLQVRDWLYVEDHCRAINMVAQRGKVGEVYNIGGHNERTNIQIVTTILEYLHGHVDPTIDVSLIRHVPDRKGHDFRYAINPQKIALALDWSPETSFHKGIIRTIDWYLSNQEWLQNITSGEYQEYYKKMYGSV